MPRTATARPPGEHVAVLSRILRQVQADRSIPKPRARRLKASLRRALEDLMDEMERRG